MGNQFDVIVLGAGPAGCSAAIELSKSKDISYLVIDRSSFPRDKICGDAIPGHAYKEIKKIFGSNSILEEIPNNKLAQKTELYNKDKKILNIAWVLKAYNVPRLDFDNFLFEKAKKEGAKIKENCIIRKVERIDSGFKLISNTNEEFTCKTLIAADGSNSIVQRTFAPKVAEQSICVGVRAYYKNVDLKADTNYVFYNKKHFGYFWAFPLSDNNWNLGFGILQKKNSDKTNLKKAFQDFIDDNEVLKEAIKNSEASSKLLGHKIPTKTKESLLSGDGFLLTGDAGYLIDPLGGHGIDTAMISGRIAAEKMAAAIKSKNTSAKALHSYNKALKKAFGARLKQSLIIRNLFGSRFWLGLPFIKLMKLLDKRLS